MLKKIAFMSCWLIFLPSVLLLSNENSEEKDKRLKEKREALNESYSETTHSVKINGKNLSYKATAGNLLLKDENGDTKASVFYIAYTKEGVEDLTKRPVTFCFNGGPGSSSIWLHLGVFGPKRVSLTTDGYGMPPYHLVDNEYSILDFTDLVFIDPVSTGFSRAAPGEDPKQFHGVDEDVKSVAQFIQLYTTRAERWLSPKFLAGESYGTTRAAALAGHLHDEDNIYLNGIILVSSVLNFQTHDFVPGNDLPFILYLPSYTATAWYHHKLPKEQQQDLKTVLQEAQQFAVNDYALALMKGNLLTTQERQDIAKRLSNYTGLSDSYIEQSNLRVSICRFTKQLLRDQRRTVGRFDSRFEGIDSDAAGETCEYDPSADAIFGAFTATFNDYIRRELKYEKDEPYKILADVRPWNFGKSNQFLNVAENLRDVMTKNPHLKVFVANGYYDLATPYFATEYTFNHLGLDPLLTDHVEMSYYDAGHMMYVHKPSLEKMKKDLAEFYTKTLKTSTLSFESKGLNNSGNGN